MDETSTKLILMVRFIAFLAFVYLLLDLLVSRLVRNPESKVRGFFALVASPLTRPVRSFLPPSATDDQVRLAALGLVGLVWVVVVLASR
jgi:uncharacterized protein YggT (Ycf19 family)